MGWDISTSIVGFACFQNDGKYIRSKYFDLRKSEKDLIDKAYEIETWVDSIIDQLKPDISEEHVHYIEDKLGGFAGGRTMQQVLLKLAAFNSTISYIIWRRFFELGYSTSVEHIHPSTVKAIMKREGLLIPKGADKKQLTLDFVVSRQPSFPIELNRNDRPQPYCFDMSDAYVTGRAGFLKNYLNLHGKSKKDSCLADKPGNGTDKEG
jgi:hypothetical protein